MFNPLGYASSAIIDIGRFERLGAACLCSCGKSVGNGSGASGNCVCDCGGSAGGGKGTDPVPVT